MSELTYVSLPVGEEFEFQHNKLVMTQSLAEHLKRVGIPFELGGECVLGYKDNFWGIPVPGMDLRVSLFTYQDNDVLKDTAILNRLLKQLPLPTSPSRPQPVCNAEHLKLTLTRFCEEMLDTFEEKEYWDDDNEHYAFEALFSAVYGPRFWPWFNTVVD